MFKVCYDDGDEEDLNMALETFEGPLRKKQVVAKTHQQQLALPSTATQSKASLHRKGGGLLSVGGDNLPALTQEVPQHNSLFVRVTKS